MPESGETQSFKLTDMRIGRILNVVHAGAIVFLYFATSIEESDKKHLCFDVKHNDVSSVNLLQGVVFVILTLTSLNEENWIMKYYNEISCVSTLLSCGSLLLPIKYIHDSCKAEIIDLINYKPILLCCMYVIGIVIVYVLLLCDRNRDQHRNHQADESNA